MASEPPPRCTHDDVALEQQCTDAGGRYCFRFTGVRAEWLARRPGPGPECSETGVGNNPGSQRYHRRTSPGEKPPNQLEHRDRGKEEP